MEAYQQLLIDVIDERGVFIDSIRSKGKSRYKRYNGSPLRYAGGKSLAVGFIAELLPSNVNRVVSPFMGGGSVEVALANEMGIDVIGYDIFHILCKYWYIQLSNPVDLADNLMRFEPDKDTFLEVKEMLKEYWDGNTIMADVDIASHYFFNMNTSYGPLFLGWPSSVYLQPKRYNSMIDNVRNFRAPNLHVECESFENSILRHKGDFLYCDPPYYLDGKMFRGMYPNSNFPVHHKGFRHDLLRDYLLDHSGGFILSYNDCDTIRDWYSDCNIETPEWQYTFGQGDTRIGENRQKLNDSSHVKKSHELLIWR